MVFSGFARSPIFEYRIASITGGTELVIQTDHTLTPKYLASNISYPVYGELPKAKEEKSLLDCIKEKKEAYWKNVNQRDRRVLPRITKNNLSARI